MVIGIVGLASFVVGFGIGVFAYAHVHAHFFAKAEALYKRKLAVEMSKKVGLEQVRIETKRKLQERYGTDLSQKHQQVIDEEVEAILGAGPR